MSNTGILTVTQYCSKLEMVSNNWIKGTEPWTTEVLLLLNADSMFHTTVLSWNNSPCLCPIHMPSLSAPHPFMTLWRHRWWNSRDSPAVLMSVLGSSGMDKTVYSLIYIYLHILYKIFGQTVLIRIGCAVVLVLPQTYLTWTRPIEADSSTGATVAFACTACNKIVAHVKDSRSTFQWEA